MVTGGIILVESFLDGTTIQELDILVVALIIHGMIMIHIQEPMVRHLVVRDIHGQVITNGMKTEMGIALQEQSLHFWIHS